MESFLVLAKGAKGAACAQLISDVLSAPGVFVFAELLETPSVVELSMNAAHAGNVRLLQLFAYGTYADYLAEASQLPQLSLEQTKKLKQLSIVTLSQSSKVLPYSLLQDALAIGNIRELEDLIIDTMYQSIVEGKLDQKAMCFRVEQAMGRDLKPGQTQQLLHVLTKWTETSQQILNLIDAELEAVIVSDTSYSNEKANYEKALEVAKQEASKSGGGGLRSSFHEMDGFDHMDEDGMRRGPAGGRRMGKGSRRKQ
ncbi:hypothetical protein BC830DRAFT_1171153 [Chytriomyces sp. MP71]|nr:hypothetical protein BC830DRAFT_1171153 [Chytriomyces sp. MP71]